MGSLGTLIPRSTDYQAHRARCRSGHCPAAWEDPAIAALNSKPCNPSNRTLAGFQDIDIRGAMLRCERSAKTSLPIAPAFSKSTPPHERRLSDGFSRWLAGHLIAIARRGT